jgi:hypothetical protein
MERYIVLSATPEMYQLYLELVVEPNTPHPRHELEIASQMIAVIDQTESLIETP